jgi:hypothetical protein
MTSDTFRPDLDLKVFSGTFAAKLKSVPVFTCMGYILVFIGYTTIFTVSLLTVGFLEIRQANMSDFNALIAVLEQRDGYEDHHLDKALDRVRYERDAYKARIESFSCIETAGAAIVPDNQRTARLVSASQDGDSETLGTPVTCAEIKERYQRHANELALVEDEGRFRSANFAFYYENYKNGITQKAPQIIPALRLLDSKSALVTLWARSPFELIEMFLLVCMGLLGGVISVMRYFVDPGLKNPAIAEFFYKPAAGAAISLGVYVLFRAAQIFLGLQNQNGPATVSTSIFLLAGFGLASGFCATEALAQIEFVATRLLRGSGRDTKSGPSSNVQGSATDRADTDRSGPATAAASPGVRLQTEGSKS